MPQLMPLMWINSVIVVILIVIVSISIYYYKGYEFGGVNNYCDYKFIVKW